MRISRIVAIAVFGLLFLAGPQLIRFYTDWLWFGEVGFRQVFRTMLQTQGQLFSATLIVSVIWFALNVRVAVATMGTRRPSFVTREGIEVKLPGPEQVQRVVLAVMTVISALIALFVASQWDTWLTFRNAVPFWQLLRGLGQALVVLAALVCGALYLVTGSLASGFGGRLSMTHAVRRHLGLLAAVFFLLLAGGAWLRRADHLLEPTALIFGGSYADVQGRMPASLVLMGVSIAGAALAVLQAFTPRNWPVPAAIAAYVAVAVGGEIYSTALQRFVVSPNEQSREAPYIQYNIDATRKAFALD